MIEESLNQIDPGSPDEEKLDCNTSSPQVIPEKPFSSPGGHSQSSESDAKPSESEQKSEQTLFVSNPLTAEFSNFVEVNKILEIIIIVKFKSEKWKIYRDLEEIHNYLFSLKQLKYAFLPDVQQLKKGTVKDKTRFIAGFLQYFNYRGDVLANQNSALFFEYGKLANEIIQEVSFQNLIQIFSYAYRDSLHMALSDFAYSKDLGLLVLALNDFRVVSSIKNFLNLSEFLDDAISEIVVYQRVFDCESKPYFKKIYSRRFFVRVSKVELAIDQRKFYIGKENGEVSSFCLAQDQSTTSFTVEPSYNFSMHNLSQGITALTAHRDLIFLGFFNNYFIVLIDNSSSMNIKYIVDLNDWLNGKGHICKIAVTDGRVFVSSYLDALVVLDYKLVNGDIVVSSFAEYKADSNIRDFVYDPSSQFLLISTREEIELVSLKETPTRANVISLRKNPNSLSEQYAKIDLFNSFTCLAYVHELKTIYIGLSNGVLLAFSMSSQEVVSARKISEDPVTKIVLLAESFVLIVSDEKGCVNFYKIGN